MLDGAGVFIGDTGSIQDFDKKLLDNLMFSGCLARSKPVGVKQIFCIFGVTASFVALDALRGRWFVTPKRRRYQTPTRSYVRKLEASDNSPLRCESSHCTLRPCLRLQSYITLLTLHIANGEDKNFRKI